VTAFQALLQVLGVGAFGLGWLRGGRPEREAVAVLGLGYFLGNLLFYVRVRNFQLGEALSDLILLIGFGWLAFRRDRWWLLVAASLQTLVMAMHLLALADPGVSARADITARWGLLAMLLLVVMAGVFERWLAGEAPGTANARWLPVRRVDDPARTP
jgi:hypothetical protein